MDKEPELEEIYRDLARVFWDVYGDYSVSEDPYNEAYLQGKKDGLRAALVLLTPLVKDRRTDWEILQETSQKWVNTRREAAEGLVRMAHREFSDTGSIYWSYWSQRAKDEGFIKDEI